MIITGPYNYKYGSVYNGNMRIALMDRDNEIIPIDRDDTVYLLAASWDLLEAAEKAQECLGDLVRGSVATFDEVDAYNALKAATKKARRE